MYSENWLTTSRIGSEFNNWSDKTAISAYTNMIKVYDWYRSVLNRNSVDNNGMKINVTVHDSTYTDNAYWDGSAMFFCDNSSGSGNTTADPTCPTASQAPASGQSRNSFRNSGIKPDAFLQAFAPMSGKKSS